MSVRSEHIPDAEYGDRVRFVRANTPFTSASNVQPMEGEGTFSLHWLGIEEVWEVDLDDGRSVALLPCFGDTMERIG